MKRLPALVLAVVVPAPAVAADTWVRARSAHAEVLTDTSEAQARRLAAHADVVHRVLQSALAPVAAPADSRPPLVLAFRDEQAFSRSLPVRDGEPQEVGGIILGGDERAYIALSAGAPSAEEALAHEYTHYVLNPVLPAQPPWMGEGLAELVAMATVWPESATLGRASDAHLRRIAREGPIPVSEVLAVGYLSPTYQGAAGTARRELFYARSWALVHWIVAGGNGGLPGLMAFAEAIAAGEEPEPAFRRCFGMSLEAAQASLATYLGTLPLPTVAVPLGAPTPTASIEVAAADAAEVDAHLGDFLMRGGRIADAREHYARALRAAAPSARGGMAALLLREGRLEDAQRHIEAALAADPGDPRALQHHAEHLVRDVARRGGVLDDAETDRAAAILERALHADPDLADAADLLARLRPAPLAHRIGLLRRATERNPERADLAFTLAGLHIRRNDLPAAARVLRRARERTRNEAHRFLADHMLARVGAVFAGQGVARGTLEAVDCLAGGALAFRVRTTFGVLRLAAESPTALFLYDASGDTVERDLTCGPAALPVTARYRPGPPGSESHRLLSLSFDGEP